MGEGGGGGVAIAGCIRKIPDIPVMTAIDRVVLISITVILAIDRRVVVDFIIFLLFVAMNDSYYVSEPVLESFQSSA
jgi:hypothetical protein